MLARESGSVSPYPDIVLVSMHLKSDLFVWSSGATSFVFYKRVYVSFTNEILWAEQVE